MFGGCFSGCSDKDYSVETTAPAEVLETTEATEEPVDESGEEILEEIEVVTDWKQAYTDLLLSRKANSSNFGYVGVNDLNLDGVPELIFSDSGASAASCVAIASVIDGEVKPFYKDDMTQSYVAEGYDENNFNYPGLYCNFEKEWITLRKNKNTGELKYVIVSHNGSDVSSFGDIYSASKGDFVLENEMSYVDYSEECEKEDEAFQDEYLVGEDKVSEEEYNEAKAEFYDEWDDTGYISCAMTNDYYEYPEKVALSITEEDLMNLFGMYEPEQ